MFVKRSLRDQLICFADFVGITLLALLFLLQLPNCFLRVCRPTLFAAVLNFSPPQTTSATSGTAKSRKLAPKRCASETINLCKNGNTVLPIILCKCPVSLPTLLTNTSIEWNLYLSWSNHLVRTFRTKMNVAGFPKHQKKRSDANRYKGYFSPLVPLKSK